VIIDRDSYPTTVLNGGDVVEIVRMVGGGRVGASSPPAVP